MVDVNTVPVANQYGSSMPFWPQGVKRLSVVLVQDSVDAGDGACVAVHGLDPDGNRVVFWSQIRPGEQAQFLAAVREGRSGTAAPPDGTVAAVKKRARSRARNENVPPAPNEAPNETPNEALNVAPDESEENAVVITTTGPGDGPGPKAFIVSLAAPSVGGAGAKAITGLSRRQTASPAARKRARPSRRK